jgi:hypothetical protein
MHCRIRRETAPLPQPSGRCMRQGVNEGELQSAIRFWMADSSWWDTGRCSFCNNITSCQRTNFPSSCVPNAPVFRVIAS